jgi:glutathione S-transferase
MKLFYAPGACSLADHIALIETGADYALEKVDIKAKRTEAGHDYTKINPKGYVPALELDGGDILTENVAILSYLASQSGKLMPAGGIGHWRVLETTAYISTELHKNFKPLFTPNSTDDEKAQAEDALGKRFGLLEERLAASEFISGDEMTVADCYLFVMLMWAKDKFGLTLQPGLDAYYDRLKQRPGIARALKEEGLG